MHEKILIIEDHDFLRRSLRGWLEANFPQCCILEAATGEEAITIAQANLPQVVVVDIALPGMSGLKTVTHLKNIVPTTQVIVLTVYEDDAYWVDATLTGTNAYVLKDKVLTELGPVLARLLSIQDKPFEQKHKSFDGENNSFPKTANIQSNLTVKAIED